MSSLHQLERVLGYTFRDESLLRLAVTHPSVAHEAADGMPHNQRLEFLGDAVLGLVLTRELYSRFQQSSEGALTKARAHLANRRTLAGRARQLELGPHLVLSRGEESTGGREKPSALADAYEAIVGAIFLDGGFEAAAAFVLRCFQDAFSGLSQLPSLENPKGELQELLQAQAASAPRYELTAIQGPDHDRSFECAVFHGEIELGRGRGKSKKAAESAAALIALQQLRQKHGSAAHLDAGLEP